MEREKVISNLRLRGCSRKWIAGVLLLLFSGIGVWMTLAIVYAENGKTSVSGRIYEFDEDNAYEFSEEEAFFSTNDEETYGSFSIAGNIRDISEKDGVPMYCVDDGNLTFSYIYGDSLLLANEDEWHLVGDKSKSVNGIKLDAAIQKGALILQTSKDGVNWVDMQIQVNLFEEIPVQTESFYTTTDVELTSGSYYRVIVVYETRIKTDSSKILFLFSKDHYESKRHAEVYEFFAYNKNTENASAGIKKYYFNSEDLLVNTGKDTGYSGHDAITEKDSHYGWSIGDFFVSGFTDDRKDEEGNPVFLKNVGDQVTLWFCLEQNIDELNGASHLSISEDENGYDQFFGIPKTNFQRGTLIVRYTDHENNKQEPQIYTNYFEANVSPNADTKVQLFEEGDYEIALDYEIKNDSRQILGRSLLPEYSNYRIYFKFSVRNGNCMVYPFDVTTRNELTNSSITENGFYLDLAKSRYLDVSIKKEVLSSGVDGLVEDTRFNQVAKDGDTYIDEGIYTISVGNRYTGQQTVKVIYVGRDKFLKASVANGISLGEVKAQVALGAQIEEDGGIILPAPEPKSISEAAESEPAENAKDIGASENSEALDKKNAAVAVILLVVLSAAFRRKKKGKENREEGDQ